MPRLRNNAPPPGAFGLNTASPQAQGLVDWRPFNGTQQANSPRDFANLGPTLAIVNTPTIVGDAEFGWAAKFVGASSQSFQSTRLPVTAPPFSFSAWVFITGVTQVGFAIALATAARTSFFALEVQAGTITARTTKTGTYSYGASQGGLASGAWYHALAVFESASLRKLFINGQLAATDGNTASGMPSLDTFFIGSGQSGSTTLDARLADARVYNRAIGPNEAYNIYAKRWDLCKTPRRRIRAWLPPATVGTRQRRKATAPPAGWYAIRRASPQAQALQASWRCDEPGGTAAFSRIVPGRDLTFHGSATRGTSLTFPSYLKLTAASSDYADTSTAFWTTYPFVFCCWVRLPAVSGVLAIPFAVTEDVVKNSRITIVDGIVAAGSTNVGASVEATGTTTLAINTWYHIAGVWESDSKRSVYVGGIKEATSTVTKDGLTGCTAFRLGKLTTGFPAYATMDIAEPRVYGRVPSDAEFQQMASPLHWDLYDTLLSRRKVIGSAAAVTSSSFRFRRTFSHLGTRTGTRQVFQ